MAVAACLAFQNDPTTQFFDQEELRPHFIEIMQSRKVSMFPIKIKNGLKIGYQFRRNVSSIVIVA